jgi:hypothetical protein
MFLHSSFQEVVDAVIDAPGTPVTMRLSSSALARSRPNGFSTICRVVGCAPGAGDSITVPNRLGGIAR